jgi:hypothetical protein
MLRNVKSRRTFKITVGFAAAAGVLAITLLYVSAVPQGSVGASTYQRVSLADANGVPLRSFFSGLPIHPRIARGESLLPDKRQCDRKSTPISKAVSTAIHFFGLASTVYAQGCDGQFQNTILAPCGYADCPDYYDQASGGGSCYAGIQFTGYACGVCQAQEWGTCFNGLFYCQ